MFVFKIKRKRQAFIRDQKQLKPKTEKIKHAKDKFIKKRYQAKKLVLGLLSRPQPDPHTALSKHLHLLSQCNWSYFHFQNVERSVRSKIDITSEMCLYN